MNMKTWRGAGLAAGVLLACAALATLALDDETDAVALPQAAEQDREGARPARLEANSPRRADARPGEAGAARCAITRVAPAAGLVLRSAFQGEYAVLASGAELMRMRLQGERELRCYGAAGEGLLLGLRHRVAVAQAQRAGDELERFAEELAGEVALRLDRRGALVGLALPAQASPEARNLLRELVNATRFVLPPAPADTWEVAGDDSTGSFQAVYACAGEQVRRTRRYTALRDAEGAAQAVVSGEFLGTLRADGLLADLAGAERIAVGAAGEAASLQVEATLRLRFLGEERLDPLSLAEAQAELERRRGPWETELRAEPGEALPAAQAPARSVAAVALELAGFVHDDDAFAQVGPRLFLELVRRLEEEPAALGEARALLLSAAQPYGVRATILDALGEVGTPAVQGLLLELTRDPALEVELLPSVYLAQGMVREPLPELLESLVAASGAGEAEHGAWSTRALGLLAGRSQDPALRAFLGEELRRSLGADSARDLVVLEALGNAAESASLPALRSYLQDADPTLRAGAVGALRHLSGAEVEGLILAGASGSEPLEVRRAALGALAARPPTPASRAALAGILQEDSLELRLEAVDTLGAWLNDPEAPEPAAVRALLQPLADDAAAPRTLREAARAELTRAG